MRRLLKYGFAVGLTLALTGLVKGAIPEVPSGTWGIAGGMAEVRAYGSAVLLKDGRVLMTGGSGPSGELASAEIFDTNGTFSAASPMSTARRNHAGVVLKDGRVLVAGGIVPGGATTYGAEIYDPASDTWSSVPGNMVEARNGQTATLLKDGSVFLAGGTGNGSVSVSTEIYDPVLNRFFYAASLYSPLSRHAAVRLQDGRVLIVGGSNGTNALATTYFYDPETEFLSPGPNLSSPRADHTATLLLNGDVLITGGNNGTQDLNSAEIYLAATGAFVPLSATLGTPRSGHQAFLLPYNNSVLIVGGASNGTPDASAELYLPWTGAFQPTGAPSAARPGAMGSALRSDGSLLLAGGEGLATSEVYRFATVKTDWSNYAPGQIVTITGSGWEPGETVTLTLLETPPFDTHHALTAVADAYGRIFNNEFSPDENDINIRFYLTAAGSRSQAQTTFKDDNTGTIIVEKRTVPGGGVGTFRFNGDAGGTIQFDGGQIKVEPLLAPGTYFSTEAVPTGWVLTSIVCDDGASQTASTSDLPTRTATFNLDPGEVVTCVFTNSRLPRLRLIKDVAPDGDPGVFDLTDSVEGIKVNDGGDGADSLFFNTTPGVHTISELAGPGTTLSNYASKIVCDSGKGSTDPGSSHILSLAYGEQVTCIFTNSRLPRLRLIKSVVPNSDTGVFDLIDSAAGLKVDDGGHGADSGFFNTTPGLHTVSELGGTGTSLIEYTSKVACDSGKGTNDPGIGHTFSLAYGEQVTCTFTNTKRGHIVVDKITVPPGDPTEFTFSPTGYNGNTDFHLAHATAPFDSGPLVAGFYSVAEILPLSGWDLTGLSCVSTHQTSVIDTTLPPFAFINLAAGDIVTCTYTDTRQPRLTVNKVVVNNNGGTKVISDFPLFVDGSPVTSGVQKSFTAGPHTVSETTLAGYQGTFSGDCAPNGSITLAAGDIKTCTITNDDVAPTLTVTKVVVNNNGGTKAIADFPLFVDAAPVISGIQASFNAGLHTVSETGLTGYLGTITGDCAANGSITLSVGDVKNCTITNDDVAPKLTVTKVVVNNNGGTKVIADFPLFVDGSPVTSGVQNNFNAGLRTVSETSLTGYLGTITGDCAANGSITLSVGDVKNCTITNDDVAAKLTVTKVVVNNNGGAKVVADFPLFVDGSPVTSGAQNNFNAGPHTISETGLAGYLGTITGDCAANGSIALSVGDIKTCTITNDDIAPKLTVTKVVINNNGGTKVIANFPLFVDASPVTSGVQASFNAGLHTVSETGQAGYLGTITGDCAANGSITLGLGDVKNCTITNDDITAKLTVTKVVVNNNGGTKVITDFPLFVDGSPVTSGAQNNFNAGAHTISETGNPGYLGTITGDCAANGSITLGLGDVKNCTITNDDIAAKLTVTKVVVNNNGGTKVIADFPLFVDAAPVTSGAQNNFNAGAHTISETGNPGYLGTITGDCAANGSITLGLGDVKNCTITNDDIAAKLTVTKVVINNSGGTKVIADFPLFVDATPVTSGVQASFNAGPHTVSETATTGYLGIITGDCAANGSISLSLGDVKNCTITNDDIAPKLTVTKVVINNNGGTKAVIDFPLFVDAAPVTSGVQASFNAGAHTVSETGLPGYLGTITGDCAANGSIALSLGDVKACTITNDDIAPKLTVTKVVINNNGGTRVIADFPLFVDASPVISGVQNSFGIGAHTVSESGLPGYAGSISGDCAANGSIALSIGDVKNCTITNDDIAARIIVDKVTIPAGDPTEFTFSPTGYNGNTDFKLAHATAPFDSGPLLPGPYSVAEILPNTGWDLTSLICVSGFQSSTIDTSLPPFAFINLAAGDTVTCTFTDTRRPRLTLNKVVVNNNGGTKVIADFPLFVDGSPVTSGVQNSFVAGAHTVSETNLTGYLGTISGDCAANGSITLSAGDVKTCTITNDDIAPKLTVTKVVVNNNGGTKVIADFPLFVDAAPVTSGAQNAFLPGLHNVSETSALGYLGTITGDCAANGSITLSLGDVKNCTITNDDIGAKLTVTKVVVNNNGGTKVIADFPLFVDASPVTSGAQNTFLPGLHNVSETSAVGYLGTITGDCAANGSITLSLGDVKNCTITNDDIGARLTVTKVVVNNNGGTKVIADFPLFVDASPVTSGVQSNFNPGLHTVSETGSIGYLGTITGDCAANGSITLSLGDVKNCTITNDDIGAKLTVTKVVVNNNGGTKVIADFPLFVDASPVTSGGQNTFLPGLHTVSETSSVGYLGTITGDCAANGSITLSLGDVKNCTITNDDIGAKLTVTKVVVNNNGGTKVIANFPLFVDASPVTSGAQNTFLPGLHTVSETSSVGYLGTITGDCAANGSITLSLGDVKNCTITNDDIGAKLTVTKVVVNNNGGTKVIADFPLFVDASPVTSGVQSNFNPGLHTVSETGSIGYLGTITGDCAANGSITLSLGDVKNCTITNDDIGAKLTVTKVVVNNNGGTKVIADFPLFVDASPVTSGGQNTFLPGPHTVSETSATGYLGTITGDCAANGSITLSLGDVKNCTITNDDVGAKLTVTKVVVNNNGGTKVIADFPLFVDASPVTSGAQNTFLPGLHTVSETSSVGYLGTITGDCAANGSITLSLGDVKNCTITNDDIGAKLTVTKVVVNNNGGTKVIADFPLFVDASPVTSGVQSNFNPGLHTVSETGSIGYLGTITGDCAANGSITLSLGDVKNCTITNDDIGAKLTVTKVVVNNNGGTKVIADFPLFVDASPVTSGGQNTFLPGPHTVSETSATGYLGTITGDCAANGSITLSLGDVKNCTITNDDIGAKLTVTKVVVNNNGGTKVIADFPLFVDASPVTSGGQNTFLPGPHTVSETSSVGYLGTITGDCAANGSITLSLGDVKNCTITNDDIGAKLTVTKVVVNNNGGTKVIADFPLFVDASPVTSGVQSNFNPGLHTVSETGSIGYLGTITGDCAANGSITLSLGDVKNCTITNDDIGAKLTVTKVVVNNNGGTKVIADFPLFVDASPVTSGGQNTFLPGPHTVSETSATGYLGTITGDCAANGSITLSLGDVKNCTITNDDIGAKLTVTKVVVNNNGGTKVIADFPLFVDASPVISGGQNTFLPGPHTVSETSAAGYIGTITGDCAANGSLTLSLGDVKNCTITNDDVAPAQAKLTVTKVVVNDNGGTKVVADFPLFVDGSPVTSSVQNTFNPGLHTVSETGLSTYLGTIGGDCAADGKITLGAGDVKTCTITNDDIAPKLIVIKHVVNNSIGTKTASDFTMNVSGTSVPGGSASFPGSESPGTTTVLNTGSFNVTESGPSGYSASLSGHCSGTISLGQTKTCTVTNTAQAPPPGPCVSSKIGYFKNNAFTPQTEPFVAEWDATPSANKIDSVVGLSEGPATGYESLAIILRFNPSGFIDARNSNVYAATNSFPYTGGQTYHFRVVVDLDHHTYDAYVKPPAGPEVKIAHDFAFRYERRYTSTLSNWATTAETGGQTVCNFTITECPPPPPPPMCTQSSNSIWRGDDFTPQAGMFVATWDSTPSGSAIDTVVGLSTNPATQYEQLAVILRFYTNGRIQARNGADYAAVNAVSYSGGVTYHFRVVVDIVNKRYDAFVTPSGGIEVQIADDYAFRAEQQFVSSLGHWNTFAEKGSQSVCAIAAQPAP